MQLREVVMGGWINELFLKMWHCGGGAEGYGVVWLKHW